MRTASIISQYFVMHKETRAEAVFARLHGKNIGGATHTRVLTIPTLLPDTTRASAFERGGQAEGPIYKAHTSTTSTC